MLIRLSPQYYFLTRDLEKLCVSHLKLEIEFFTYDNYSTNDSYLLKQITLDAWEF